MESTLSIFRESYLSRYSIFTPGLARAFLSALFVKHFPTQSHGKAATSQWAACNVTIFFALQEGIEMKKLIALKFPYTARRSGWDALMSIEGALRKVWMHCCSWMHSPQTSLLSFWGSKSPFTSRNIRSIGACMMLSLLLQRGFAWTQTDSISTNIQINKP